MIGMAGLLLGIGALTLHAGWSSWWLLGLGVAMWLFAMCVLMPLTGAGLFASSLFISPVLTSAGYFVVFLGYSSVLIGGRLILLQGFREPDSVLAERRALLLGLVGTLTGMATARIAGREGGLVASSLPLANPPTRQPAATATTTGAVATAPTPTDRPQPAAAGAGGPTPTTMPATAATATL